MSIPKKFVRWCFTSFDIEHPPQFDEEKMICMVFQKEQCPETGKLHFQGAFQLRNKNGMQLKSVKKLFYDKGVHLEAMNGTWEQSNDYCSKDKTRIEGPWRFGKEPLPKNTANAETKKRKFDEIMQDIKEGFTKKQLINKHTDHYIRNHNAIDKVFEMFSVKPSNSKYEMRDFSVKEINWNRLKKDFKTQCVVVEGPTGCGKSQWALAHFKNPIDVRNIEDLRNLDETNDGLVFNDMEFLHWPITAQINLLDWDSHRSLHARYNNLHIPAGMKMIFTTNRLMFTSDPAIDRRFVKMDITEKMFKNEEDTEILIEESE